MITLSTVIEKTSEIQRIADIIGFKNICIFKGLETNEEHMLHLLVEVDQENPNASFTNKSLLAFILREDLLKCDVDVVIRSNIPSYLFQSILPIPLLITKKEIILKLLGSNITFKKEIQKLSDDDLNIEQMEQAAYRIAYEKMTTNKIQSDNLKYVKQQVELLGEYISHFDSAYQLKAECYLLEVIEKIGGSIEEISKMIRQPVEVVDENKVSPTQRVPIKS